jgi:hypothetical protein
MISIEDTDDVTRYKFAGISVTFIVFVPENLELSIPESIKTFVWSAFLFNFHEFENLDWE